MKAPPPPCEVYTSSLSTLHQGHALWYPEPHDSGEVQIGDVGYIHEGAFIRLFNVQDKEFSIYRWPKKTFTNPDVFSSDAILCETRKDPLVPGPYRSNGVVESSGRVSMNVNAPGGAGPGLEAGFTCTLDQGAVLILGSDARKEVIMDNFGIREYVQQHHSTWCAFVREDREGPRLCVPAERIVLVRGWVKTAPTWKATAFCSGKTSVDGAVDVEGTFGSARAHYSRSRAVSGIRLSRKGTSFGSAVIEGDPDQCVFISTYQVKYRVFGLLGTTLRAAAGPHELPDDRDGRSGGTAEGVHATDVIVDTDDLEDEGDNAGTHGPVDDLLDFILEVSDCEIAIACEEDIYSIVVGQPWPADMPAFLRQSQLTVETKSGVGMLSLPEKIRRERQREFLTRDITDADRDVYPNIDSKDAATLADGRALIGPERKPTEWQHLKMQHKDLENGAISCMAMSPDGKLVAAAWDDITVTVWRLADGLTVQILCDQGHMDTIWVIAFSPDGQQLVSCSADTTALLWNVKTGDIAHRFEGHTEDVVAAAYSPDGTVVATSSSDCTLKLWSPVTGQLLHNLTNLGSDVRHIIFSPTGARLATSSDAAVTLWDAQTGARTAKLTGHTSAVWCMAFSPDGDRLVSGSEDNSARVWDTGAGEELVVLHEHTSSVWAAAFAPDGSAVATASYDGTVVACDSFTGERIGEYSDAGGAVVEAVAYAPRHNLVATGAADGKVRVWNAKTGGFVVEFEGHEEKVKNVQFTPDGLSLVSHADDSTVRVWNVVDALRLL